MLGTAHSRVNVHTLCILLDFAWPNQQNFHNAMVYVHLVFLIVLHDTIMSVFEMVRIICHEKLLKYDCDFLFFGPYLDW